MQSQAPTPQNPHHAHHMCEGSENPQNPQILFYFALSSRNLCRFMQSIAVVLSLKSHIRPYLKLCKPKIAR